MKRAQIRSRLGRSASAGLGLLVLSSIAASAAPIADCVTIRTSGRPYQLEMEENNSDRYVIQIYPGDHLTRTQYKKSDRGVDAVKFQANFQIENDNASGNHLRFVYDVPTDRYIWQQETRVVQQRTVVNGQEVPGPPVEQIYDVLPDEVVAVGSCSFKVVHYRVKQASSSIKADQEVWFSPELNAVLRLTSVTTLAIGKVTTVHLDARAIATEFAPLR